jgi:hypothetical protein
MCCRLLAPIQKFHTGPNLHLSYSPSAAPLSSLYADTPARRRATCGRLKRVVLGRMVHYIVFGFKSKRLKDFTLKHMAHGFSVAEELVEDWSCAA